jgi:TctA family transporter
MEMLNQTASVPAIVAVVYILLYLFKYAVKNEKWVRLIPVFAVILGGILGIICYYKIPNLMPVENVLVAFLIGAASGSAATGANQIFKQLGKAKQDTAEATKQETEE